MSFKPHRSPEQRLRELNWRFFYNKLMERDEKSLNLVIETLDGLIESVSDESKSNERISYFVRQSLRKQYNANGLDIQGHLLRYLGTNNYFGDRSCWNAIHDISRCLKRVRDDEAVYLLPDKDKELTSGFLERLKYPLRKERYY